MRRHSKWASWPSVRLSKFWSGWVKTGRWKVRVSSAAYEERKKEFGDSLSSPASEVTVYITLTQLLSFFFSNVLSLTLCTLHIHIKISKLLQSFFNENIQHHSLLPPSLWKSKCTEQIDPYWYGTSSVLQLADLLKTLRPGRLVDDALLALHPEGDFGDSFTNLVNGTTSVLARVFGVHTSDVQSHISKVKGCMETCSRLQELAIVVPLDFQGWIMHRLNAAFQVHMLSLRKLGVALKWTDLLSIYCPIILYQPMLILQNLLSSHNQLIKKHWMRLTLSSEVNLGASRGASATSMRSYLGRCSRLWIFSQPWGCCVSM